MFGTHVSANTEEFIESTEQIIVLDKLLNISHRVCVCVCAVLIPSKL